MGDIEEEEKITAKPKFNKDAVDTLTNQLFIRLLKPPGSKEQNPHQVTRSVVESGLVGSFQTGIGHQWRILGMRQKRVDNSYSTEYDVERIAKKRECEGTEFIERVPINRREHILKLCRYDNESDHKVFMNEVHILRQVVPKLKHRRHREAFPGLLAVGETKELRYINLLKDTVKDKYLDVKLDKPRPFYIVERVEPNLEAVFTSTKAGLLASDTSVYMTIGAMRALRFLHDEGIVHRNVQPSSFAIRLGPTGLLQRSEAEIMERVVLIDLTKCRKYLSPDPLCKPRRLVPFNGNLKYSSIAAMEMAESTFVDDLVGCCWMLTEFIMGNLPWFALKKVEEVLESKKNMSEKDLEKCPIKGIPDLIKSIQKSNGFKRPPNYDTINMTLMEMMDKKDNKMETVKPEHCMFGFEHAAQLSYRHGMERADGKKICEVAMERENLLKGKNDIFLVGKKKEVLRVTMDSEVKKSSQPPTLQTTGEEGLLAEDNDQIEAPQLPIVNRGSVDVGERTTFVSNMFDLKVEPGTKIFKYRLDLVCVTDKKEMDLTRGPRQDFPTIERRRVLFSIFYDFVKKNKFGDIGSKYATIYDCGNYVYSKALIPDGERTLEMAEISSSNSRDHLHKNAEKVKAKIRNVTTFFVDTTSNCLETKQFLEVLAAACITRDGTHLIYNNKMYNRSQDREVEEVLVNGRVLKHGAEKCVRITGSSSDASNFALQLDAKKSPFWKEENLLNLICDELGCSERDLPRRLEDRRALRKLDSMLKDVFVESTHVKPTRKFAISGVHSGSAESTFFDHDGKEMSVSEYFHEVHHIRLKYPLLPLILERKPKSKSYHPIECLFVPRGQRITMQKSTPLMTQAMIKKCQMTPKFLVQHVLNQKDDFSLGERNKYLQEFKVSIGRSPLITNGYKLLPPAIAYQSGDLQPNNMGTIDWKLFNKKFTRPVDVKGWIFIIFDRCVRIEEVDQFAKNMVQNGRGLGMIIDPQPLVCDIYCEQLEAIVDVFRDAKKKGFQLIMAVTKNKIDDVHDVLKGLEAQHGVVTQHISHAVFDKVLNRNLMCTNNLLLKMNPKTGGVNHTVALSRMFKSMDMNTNMFDTRSRMFVGISISHAGPQSFADRAMKMEQSEPTVVAMTHSLKMATELTSDYWYQKPRLATISDIEDHFADALEKWKLYCGALPNEIIVFRAGSSEGEFTKVQLEMQMLASVFARFNGGQYKPSLTTIVVMKDSNYRLFPDGLPSHGPPKEQNVRPGSIVDQGITNPAFSEFIMVPHTALQGSCRPIRCTVVTYNQGQIGTLLTLKEIEVLTNGLCYAHQASTTSTGIPAILYASENVAKRGRNNWKYFNFGDDHQSVVSGSSGGHGKYTNDGSPDFFQRMTREMQSKAAGMYWA